MKRCRAAEEPPALSVVLPVYNAMPWLPTTLLHLLRQQLHADAGIQLVAVVDGCSDGSLEFLQQLVAMLGSNRAAERPCEPPIAPGALLRSCPAADVPDEDKHKTLVSAGLVPSMASVNPAFAQPLRASEIVDHPSFATGHVANGTKARSGTLEVHKAPTVAEVAASCRREHHLLVLYYNVNCGQGAAMSLALSHCRAPFIAQVSLPGVASRR